MEKNRTCAKKIEHVQKKIEHVQKQNATLWKMVQDGKKENMCKKNRTCAKKTQYCEKWYKLDGVGKCISSAF